MRLRSKGFAFLAVVILLLGAWVCGVRIVRHMAAGSGSLQTGSVVAPKPADNTSHAVVQVKSGSVIIKPGQILAIVNGHEIHAEEVVPVGTNQELEVSSTDLKFFLNRAIDRELIHEAARAQGVALDDSQQAQMTQFDAMRRQREPNLLKQINASEPGYGLEMSDAQAFVLQTSLMAQQGYSPDVSEAQVNEYYQQHASDFAGIPTDMVNFQIRSMLAPSQRLAYQNELNTYMSNLRAAANILQNSL